MQNIYPTLSIQMTWTMKNLLRVAANFLAISFLSASSIAWGEEQTIRVPGEGWRIRFDAPKLSPGPAPAPGERRRVFYGSAGLFQLTFFVEPPRCVGPDTDENIYACFLPNLLKNPYIVSDSIRANTVPNGVQVMAFSRVQTERGTGTNFSMHLLFAQHGKWADVHASFASPTKDDVRALAAIMSSIKIEDDPEPAAVER